MTDLCTKKCVPCEGGVPTLTSEEVNTLKTQLHDDWQVTENGTTITRIVKFKGYYKTMSFVNAVAWIANQEGHHPDMVVSFNQCVVNFTTHAINGLSENDFICAKKVDTLL